MFAIASNCNDQGFIEIMMGYLMVSSSAALGIEFILGTVGAIIGTVALPFLAFGLGIAASFLISNLTSEMIRISDNCGPGSGN